MNKQIKIAVFFGGKITKHLVLIRAAAKKLGVDLDLVSYNSVYFDTKTGKIGLRNRDINDFEVVFFRTTGKHWEEVDLIVENLRINSPKTVIVDLIVKSGKPSYACKAWQMLKLAEAGIPVPKTIYGSLWFLHETMKSTPDPSFEERRGINFPVIVKGSGGDRGTRVFKADNLAELEKLVRGLRKTETEEGKRYMLQEYIENKGDYRVLILGNKVLGVMKRSCQSAGEFRNNFSVGGKVEVAELSEAVKQMAIKAAEVCEIAIAGVDVMPKGGGYVVLEVNKGPQFTGFMKATGIDVPMEIVKYLVSLAK